MSLALVTPSYSHDAQLFADLHRSVIRMTDESVIHYVVVPNADVQVFAEIVGSRGSVIPEESLYPAHYKTVGWLNSLVRLLPFAPPHARIAAVNVKNQFRPVRGWMMQQLLKLEVCRQLEVATALLIDSDVELVRPISEATFRDGDHARLYRRPNAVNDSMPVHQEWSRVSRQLLGLTPRDFPTHEYVSSLCVWEPRVVQAMLAHVERVTGLHWMDAITKQRTFSEWTLYGVYAEEIAGFDENSMTESSLCHSYWGELERNNPPLELAAAVEFVARIKPDDVAVLIQSKTRTPREVRRAAIDALSTPSSDNDRATQV